MPLLGFNDCLGEDDELGNMRTVQVKDLHNSPKTSEWHENKWKSFKEEITSLVDFPEKPHSLVFLVGKGVVIYFIHWWWIFQKNVIR